MPRLVLALLALLLFAPAACAAESSACPAPAGKLASTTPYERKAYSGKRQSGRTDAIDSALAARPYATIGIGDSIMYRWPEACWRKRPAVPR